MFTGWSNDKGSQQIKDLLASGKKIDGVWTSGVDSVIVDAYKSASVKFVPVVGADNNGFIAQMIEDKGAGLVAIAVTNPPAVGGAGLGLALAILGGKKAPHVIHLTPQVYMNTDEAGMSWAKSVNDPKVDPTYPVYSGIPPYTSYSPAEEKACKGPGEP